MVTSSIHIRYHELSSYQLAEGSRRESLHTLSGSFISNENDHLTFSVFVHIHGPVSLLIIVFDFILSVGVDQYRYAINII